MRELFTKKGRAAIVQNVGPMFQIMFTDQPAIRDYREFCQLRGSRGIPEVRAVAVSASESTRRHRPRCTRLSRWRTRKRMWT